MNVKMLKEYLENVRALEEDAYTYSEMIGKLEAEKKSVSAKRVYTAPIKPDFSNAPTPPDLNVDFSWFIFWLNYKLAYLDGIACAFLVFIVGFFFIDTFAHLLLITFASFLLTSFLFAYCKTEDHRNWEKKQLLSEYQERKKKYDDQTSIARKEYDKKQKTYYELSTAEDRRYDKEKKYAEAYNLPIEEHLREAKKRYNETTETLNKLYSLNIIYPKYRGLIPVTMFCEYINSGRRTELEGINGMYDLYEEELRGKIIINSLAEVNRNLGRISYQLGNISRQLEGIQCNQTMLYEEVARGNSIAEEINKGVKETAKRTADNTAILHSISQSNSRIEHNSELTAFAAESAARNAASIEKMQKYEFSLRHPSYMP